MNIVFWSTSLHALSPPPPSNCFSSLTNDVSPQRHVLFIIHERVTGGGSFIKGSCNSDKIRLMCGCWSLFIPVTWLQRAGTPHPIFPAPTRNIRPLTPSHVGRNLFNSTNENTVCIRDQYGPAITLFCFPGFIATVPRLLMKSYGNKRKLQVNNIVICLFYVAAGFMFRIMNIIVDDSFIHAF